MAIPAGLMKVDDTPANERCYAVDACLALALHTLRITPNFRMVSVLTQVDEQGNVHKRRIEDDVSHADVVLRIRDLAQDIYASAYVANSANVGKDPSVWQERCNGERLAIAGLREMIASIQLARFLFHLRGNKVAYWNGLAQDALALCRKWHESDVKRYSQADA